MKGRGKTGSYFSRLFGGSRIWSRLFPESESASSNQSGVFLKEDALFSGGMLGTLYNKMSVFAARIRAFLAAYAEESYVLSRLSAFCRGVLDTSVGSVGVFLFFTGIYSAAAFLINMYADNAGDLIQLVYSAVIAFMGLILMPVRRSLLGCIRSSFLISYITEEILAISPFALDTELPAKKHFGWAVLFGTLAGLTGFFVSPLKILLFLLFLAGAAAVLYSPEGGLYIAAFLLPFASPWISAAVALLAAVSYVFKLLVGKRNFYLTAADVFVFIFLISLTVAGLVTPFFYGHTLLLVVTIAALYLLCSNLMRSGEQLYRLMSALSSGLLVLALCCIFSSLFGGELGELGAYISGKSAYSVLLPVLLPAALCTAFSRGAFSSGAVCCAVTYAAVILTFSEWMYLAAVFVTAMFLLVCFRRRVGIIFGALLVSGAVMVLFGTGIINGELYTLPEGSSAAADTLLKHGLYGIGLGEKAFTFAFRSAGYSGVADMDMYTALVISGGWLCLVLFIAAFALLLRRGVFSVNGKMRGVPKYSASAAVAVLCTLAVCGAFGGIWLLPECIMLFSVMCGALSSLPRIYMREAGEEYEIE